MQVSFYILSFLSTYELQIESRNILKCLTNKPLRQSLIYFGKTTRLSGTIFLEPAAMHRNTSLKKFLTVNNMKTGRVFKAGKINDKVLANSLGP